MSVMTASWTPVAQSTKWSLTTNAVAAAYTVTATVTPADPPRSPGVGALVRAEAVTTAMTAQPSGLSSSRWWCSRWLAAARACNVLPLGGPPLVVMSVTSLAGAGVVLG